MLTPENPSPDQIGSHDRKTLSCASVFRTPPTRSEERLSYQWDDLSIDVSLRTPTSEQDVSVRATIVSGLAGTKTISPEDFRTRLDDLVSALATDSRELSCIFVVHSLENGPSLATGEAMRRFDFSRDAKPDEEGDYVLSITSPLPASQDVPGEVLFVTSANEFTIALFVDRCAKLPELWESVISRLMPS